MSMVETIKNPNVLRKQEEQLHWVNGLLTSAQMRRWYGKITIEIKNGMIDICLLYTSPSPRDLSTSRMPSSA